MSNGLSHTCATGPSMLTTMSMATMLFCITIEVVVVIHVAAF